MKEKEFKFGGDMNVIISGPSVVDVSDMNFFDELEYDCWDLIKKYAKEFGFEVNRMDGDEDDIDFYASKQVQERIIELFKEAGISFNYSLLEEQNIGQQTQCM